MSEDPCLVENTVSVFCFYRKEKDKAIMHRRSNEEKIFCIFMSNLKLVYNFFNVLIQLVTLSYNGAFFQLSQLFLKYTAMDRRRKNYEKFMSFTFET